MEKLIWMVMCLVIGSCSQSQNRITDTPNEFKQRYPVSHANYYEDSIQFKNDLSELLKTRAGIFYSYDDRYVDTAQSSI
ncbi:MAG TPA: hypothetical protein VGN64_16190, partial [Dyadobacter sp.]|nr:hypothetical protein [Dyadobacter sp.]